MTLSSGAAKRSALVTGATGAIGPVLVSRLVTAGWVVRALARRPEPAQPGVHSIAADILDPKAVCRAVDGVDVVFHLAAAVHSEAARPDKATPTRINVSGTEIVASAARAAGVSRFIYFSSTAVYGRTDGQVANEQSTPRPITEYARTKLLGEGVAQSHVPAVILRVATTYGPSMSGNYLKLARLIARQRVIGVRGRNRRTLVYQDDVADAAVAVVDHPAAVGRIFNVTGGSPRTLDDIVETIARVLGRRRPMLNLSAALGSHAVSAVERIVPFATLAQLRTALEKLAEDSAVDGNAIRTGLGFEPRWSFEEGWRHTIAAWRAHGLL